MTAIDGAARWTGPVPKRVPVGGHPIRWYWAQLIAWSFLAANIGTLVIVALYYIFVQIKWPGLTYGGHHHTILYLKPGWDHLFGWDAWPADRHNIRNVYEGVWGSLFVGSVMAKWRKKDTLRKPAPGWYVAISPLLIVAVSLPLVLLGVAVLDHWGPDLWHQWFGAEHVGNPVHFPHFLSWLATYVSGFPWQPLLLGAVVGQAVRRVYAPAGNAVNGYFTGRAVDTARDAEAAGEENPESHLPRFPLPPNIRERAWYIWLTGEPVPDRTRSIAWAVRFAALLTFCLAGYGGYVKYVIARGSH